MAIARINVLNYQALGRKFIAWAKDPTTRPKDLTELATQLTGIVGPLPSYIKSLMFVQAREDLLLIRLPPEELVKDTEAAIAAGGTYQIPPLLQGFYSDCVNNAFYAAGTQADRQKTFECRVGDYVIAHCW